MLLTVLYAFLACLRWFGSPRVSRGMICTRAREGQTMTESVNNPKNFTHFENLCPCTAVHDKRVGGPVRARPAWALGQEQYCFYMYSSVIRGANIKTNPTNSIHATAVKRSSPFQHGLSLQVRYVIYPPHKPKAIYYPNTPMYTVFCLGWVSSVLCSRTCPSQD